MVAMVACKQKTFHHTSVSTEVVAFITDKHQNTCNVCYVTHTIAEATVTTTTRTRMWANAQHDGRIAEYRWRPLFNATVWLASGERHRCSNEAKMQNPLKITWVPKQPNWSQPLVGQSSPYCDDMWRRYYCLTFPWLSIYALVAKI